MQGDLISRRAALELSYCAIKPNYDCPSVASVVDVEDIEKLPAVDAVPVVRCKDCKHRGGYNCPMYHTETSLDDLDGFDDYNVDRTDSDGFCHRGERRE